MKTKGLHRPNMNFRLEGKARLLTFDLRTAAGLQKWREFLKEAADLVVHYKGSLSGEHGDGQARGELLARMYSPRIIDAFREFKQIWDPDWKMNPGKVIDPYR